MQTVLVDHLAALLGFILTIQAAPCRNLTEEESKSTIREVPIPEATLTRYFGIVARKGSFLSPALKGS